MFDLGIINGDIYLNGVFMKKNIYIKDGLIQKIDSGLFDCQKYCDAKDRKVLPGLIDPHVHFELRGVQYTSSDDFESGSISAAYGGITTIIDFLDPIDKGNDLEEALYTRRNLARKSVIDYSFHVTIKNPIGEVAAIVNEMKRLKLHRLKLFTTYSDSGRRTYEKEIRELLSYSEKDGFLILAHIEDDRQIRMEEGFQPKDLFISRPSKAEGDEAIRLAEMVKETGGKLYMVHCSSGSTIKRLKETYEGLLNKQLFIESCPHYFILNEEILGGEAGYLYTMAPPLRTKEEQQLLREQIEDVITIGTDHCPFMKGEKNKRFLRDIPMGIGGVEQSFSIMYQLFGNKVIDKMTINPAKIHGLYPKKGILQEGSDADIVIIEEKERTITSDHSRCDYSVYHGFQVNTDIVSTLVRGQFIIQEGQFVGAQGAFIE